MIAGERINGTAKSGRTRVVSIDEETVAVLRQHKADQAADQLHAGDSWRGVRDGFVAARLGHADPAITVWVYAHVIRTAEAAAADIFAQAVKAA